MMIDRYLYQSGVVVWNYLMLIGVVAFDGHLFQFVDKHLREKEKQNNQIKFILETRFCVDQSEPNKRLEEKKEKEEEGKH